MSILDQDRDIFEKQLLAFEFPKTPRELFEPIQYLLGIGGKRIRPALVLATAKYLGGQQADAMHAATAVELFHNFSLMHDDIMDNANLRRGEPTVHQKYNVNTAILSGDVMLIYAYKLLGRLPKEAVANCFEIFTKMAEEVCIGQQMDMNFETAEEVAIMDYLKMIELKTSVLVGACMQIGARLSGADEQSCYHLYEFGKNIGIAFQIQDDILDTYGDEATFGKSIGGDIVNNKKTYLYLKSLQLLSEEDASQLKTLFQTDSLVNLENKVKTVMHFYKQAGARVYADELKNEYKMLALSHLQATPGLTDEARSYFTTMADYLIQRDI